MSRELFSAVSGAQAAWSQLDVVSHNLANVSTNGYRARKMTFQLAQDANNRGVLGQAYTEPGESPLDLANGSLEKTDDPLNIAIQGKGFFEVQTADGRRLLTRSGDFQLDPQGMVVTSQGHQLMSSAGPVQLLQGEQLIVRDNGVLAAQGADGSVSDRGFLQIMDGEVTPLGTTLYEAKGEMTDVVQAGLTLEPGEAPPVQLRQGHLERSNVDPLGAMVELIEASRYFEACQKLMKASDEADQRLIRTGRT